MFGEEEFMLNDFEENGMAYGDVFDKIEDLLDFSSEEMQMLMEPEPLTFDDAALPVPSCFPPPRTTTEAPPPVEAPPPATSVADDDTFPCEEDEAELEWLSNFVEESFSPTNIVIPKTNNSPSNGMTQINGPEPKPKTEFRYNRTPSPVSVLEDKVSAAAGGFAGGAVSGGGGGGVGRRRGGGGVSFATSSSSTSSSPTSSSSGCSSGVGNGVTALASAFNPPDTVAAVRGRAPRTKRPRPSAGARSNILLPIEDDSSLLMVPSIISSDVDSFADSIPHNPFDDYNNGETTTATANNNKKKKRLKIVSSASVQREAEPMVSSAPLTSVRKCMHCEIQKTPQWRAGPMGPKTLCNACGVRYKSGRLFPEYRPAASPTFVPTHHSNSHKKVVEMRVKSSSGKDSMSEVPSSLPVSARGCELLHYIRSC